MKSIIIAGLLGAMTLDEVNALNIKQLAPKGGIAEQAAAIAEKAGNVDKEKENKQTIKAQAPAEQAESRAAEAQAAALTKTIEARIQAESQIKIAAKADKLSPEEREERLNKKIDEEIKARK